MPQETCAVLRVEIASLLGVPAAELKEDADLFELGFDSILLVQLLRRLREHLGVELHLNDLFVRPTITGLSEVIAQAARN